MKGKAQHYNGIYHDMFIILGEEVTKKIYQFYRGQQVTFPMKLYSNEYVKKYIINNHKHKTLKEMCRELGYTEGWIKQLLNKINTEE